jgi:hypothetical protein
VAVMRNGVGVFDPEQLRALQSVFNETWLRATGSNLTTIGDWGVLRDNIAQRVMNYAQSDLTNDEIVRTVLASLNIS